VTVPHDCPTCGASVPADAAWCSLCFARFDVFDPLTAPLDQVAHLEQPGGGSVATAAPAAPAAPTPVADPLVDPLHDVDGELSFDPLGPAEQPAAPQEEMPRDTAEPVNPPDPAPDVDAIFARLAAEYPHSDPLSPWADRLGDRSNRVVFMVVGSLGAAAVLFGLLSILSLLG